MQGTLNVVEAAGQLRGAGRVHLDRRGAVRRRGADADRARSAIPAPLSPYGASKWAAEAYVEHVVAVVGHPARGVPARQRVRPAPEPARRGRRGGDLRPPPVHRRGAQAVRPRHADARLRVRRRRRRARCWPRPGARARTTSPPASRRTWRPSGASSSAPPASRSSRELADLRPGELTHSCLDISLRRARAGLARRRCRSPRGCG